MENEASVGSWIRAAIAQVGGILATPAALAAAVPAAIAGVLSLATRDELAALRTRVAALEALLARDVADECTPRPARVSPRLREALGRASEALAGPVAPESPLERRPGLAGGRVPGSGPR